MLARDRGDECLRSVAASHAEQVGTARDRVLGQLAQVVTWMQDDRLDAVLSTQVDQPEALGLASTGFEVHEQDRVTRTRRPLDCSGCRGRTQRVARRGDRHRGEPKPDREHDKALANDDHHREYNQRKRRDADSNDAGYPASGQDVPGGDHRDSERDHAGQ